MTTRPPLVLIGCSARKLTIPAPARDLYRGDLFRKSVAWAESRGMPWLVLSALHGVVGPDDVIAPYCLSLNGMSSTERRAWAASTGAKLRRRMPLDRPIILLAGWHYREFLTPLLKSESSGPVTSPLSQLGIGEQKARLLRSISTGEPL